MPLAPYRTLQSTNTAGTGTITLLPAVAASRSFQAAYGSSPRVLQYVIDWTSGFEVGIGEYDGGAPGTITRVTPLARQEGGSGLAVLPAGTKNVYPALFPAERPLRLLSGSATLGPTDLGNLVQYSGSGGTITLPAPDAVPQGTGYLIRHGGSGMLVLDPAGAATIDGGSAVYLMPGDAVEVISATIDWLTINRPTGWRRLDRQLVAGVNEVIFSLPTGPTHYRLEVPWVTTTYNGTTLLLQTSINGGVSFENGATDYTTGLARPDLPAGQQSSDAINLTWSVADNQRPHSLTIDLYPGDTNRVFTARTVGGVCSAVPEWQPVMSYGSRGVTGARRTIRIAASTPTLSGEFALMALAP